MSVKNGRLIFYVKDIIRTINCESDGIWVAIVDEAA